MDREELASSRMVSQHVFATVAGLASDATLHLGSALCQILTLCLGIPAPFGLLVRILSASICFAVIRVKDGINRAPMNACNCCCVSSESASYSKWFQMLEPMHAIKILTERMCICSIHGNGHVTHLKRC